MTISLSGTALAAAIRAGITGTPARLAIVTATTDEATAWYVRSISAAAAKVGISCEVVETKDVAGTLSELGNDIHGIILATPVPGEVPAAEFAMGIPPTKDVDGANPVSLGRLAAGLPAFAPATAEAVVRLLEHHHIEIAGRRAMIVGRSTVVGKPLAHLLLNRHATVTVAHSRTPDLAAVTREADILIAAAGRAGLIGPDHVRPGAVVIDVGTNPTADGGLVGDVDPAVADRAGALSPVPGGVGPVTTALLLSHTVDAARTAAH
ncbi:bifunctional 5,10-methylenetetrahydrofolate dehydrogenase/5,10-methenyltetrahydrofolate cyclohydrolase [Fodinicola feengrottensis]|uniref:Bifunctional protein FolD n=1 Tax=Fodinicola feengrottensis TaxID=435914 RepID=A0ABN2HX37_9ACTN